MTTSALTMKKRHPFKTNVLLVNITRLGDMLQATPTIAGLKMENPGCKVTVLVEKQFEDVCRIIPNVDEVRGIDLNMTVRSIIREGEGIIDAYESLHAMVEDMKQDQYDYCLNMSSSAYTALLLNVLGIKRRGGWTSDEEGYRIIESDWARLFASSVFHQNRQYNSLNLVDVFRCSADVHEHPRHLLLDVPSEADAFAESLIREAGFTNTGPIICVQAGASQGKRQWLPHRFIAFIRELLNKMNARVIMVGTKKELSIIDPIKAGVESDNVFVAAGKTDIPQLSALLKRADLLVTGDTGPMHISVAVGTPVVAMFLASAFGFETGPYSEGNLVLQPVIGCGPCNPNKPCSRPDCHDHIEPEVLAELVRLRIESDFRSVPDGLIDPNRLLLYRSEFDKFGFCDLRPVADSRSDHLRVYRDAYRRLWLEELGGFSTEVPNISKPSKLALHDEFQSTLREIKRHADQGVHLISELVRLINDMRAPGRALGEVNQGLSELDRRIEELGFHVSPLGPLTRMFVFAKENLIGSEPLGLASQMNEVYGDLSRRCVRLSEFYTAAQAG